jgi:hypothetical protein
MGTERGQLLGEVWNARLEQESSRSHLDDPRTLSLLLFCQTERGGLRTEIGGRVSAPLRCRKNSRASSPQWTVVTEPDPALHVAEKTA